MKSYQTWVVPNLPEKRNHDRFIYIFLDGVGLGTANAQINPFAKFDSTFFSVHGGGDSARFPGEIISTDAHMSIEGLPQSATGQTALFTGYNGAQIVGRHINGFPTFSLRPYLKTASLFNRLLETGYKATLLNSYSDRYLKRLNHRRAERMMSASSLLQMGSGQPYFTIDDYLQGKSMYMDITNWFLRKHGQKISLVKPEESGRKLARLAREYDTVVYEYFFTDKIGHEQSWGAAKRILSHVDGLLSGVWEEIDPQVDTVIVSSDHGNMEDLSTKSHTHNKVGTLLGGKHAAYLAKSIQYLYDIPRQILKLKNVEFLENIVLHDNGQSVETAEV
ncbi:MAG: metalloenzyme [Leptospiraceae bacterium]|nr:metalloenzyme [Leptospiraceae bacterium]